MLGSFREHFEYAKRGWLNVRHSPGAGALELGAAYFAERALATGDHGTAVRIADRLTRWRPAKVGEFYLAQSRLLHGDYTAAIEHLTRLLASNPAHPDATYLLADALLQSGQGDRAWRVLESVGAKSGRIKTWIVMANMVDTEADYQRFVGAFRAWEKAGLKPGFQPHAQECLAVAAMRAGHYEEARQIWQGVLRAALAEPAPALGQVSVVRPFTRRAETALLDVKRALDVAGIEVFLVSGTLLGCVREGALLSHDKDVDVGVWEDVPRTQLLSAIRAVGRFYLMPSRSPYTIRIKHVSGVGVDVFVHVREPNDYWHAGSLLKWHNAPFELVPRDFMGQRFLVPEDHHTYLVENYGADWRDPKPVFDSAFDTPNGEVLNPEELCLRAYKMLSKAVLVGDTARAGLYLAHLERFGEADFVRHVREHLMRG